MKRFLSLWSKKAKRKIALLRNKTVAYLLQVPEEKIGRLLWQEKHAAKKKMEKIYMAIASCQNAEQVASVQTMIDLFQKRHTIFHAEASAMRKALTLKQEHIIITI